MSPTWDVSELGGLLKERRKKSGLSLRDLANKIDVSLNTLSRVERGHVPDLTNFRRIIDWLDVPADAFLRSDGEVRVTQVIARHLRSDPNLSAEAADKISSLVEDMYLKLAPQGPRLAIHLRSHKTFTPVAGELLSEILGEMQSRLSAT